MGAIKGHHNKIYCGSSEQYYCRLLLYQKRSDNCDQLVNYSFLFDSRLLDDASIPFKMLKSRETGYLPKALIEKIFRFYRPVALSFPNRGVDFLNQLHGLYHQVYNGTFQQLIEDINYYSAMDVKEVMSLRKVFDGIDPIIAGLSSCPWFLPLNLSLGRSIRPQQPLPYKVFSAL